MDDLQLKVLFEQIEAMTPAEQLQVAAGLVEKQPKLALELIRVVKARIIYALLLGVPIGKEPKS